MKNIKIILLSFSLAASLTVPSYAMSQSKYKNDTTILSKNYHLQNKTKKKQYSPNMYDDLAFYYKEKWSSQQEKENKKDIEQSLQQFGQIFPIYIENITAEDISQMSNLDFNKIQSILLDYYNFSVLFNKKYSAIISLLKVYKYENDTGDKVLKNWKPFNTSYKRFVGKISNYVKLLNNFCYKILFDNDLNIAIQKKYFNNMNTKNIEDEEIKKLSNEKLKNLENKNLEQLSDLTKDLQDIFEKTNTKITKDSSLWTNTFKPEQITNNNFIDENALIKNDINALIKNFEVTPKIDKNYKIPTDLKDNIPSQYKINSYILAAIYKMELLKSTCYMNKLAKNNLLKNENTENIFKSYDEAKRYTNDIFKTYNSLRSLIVLDKTEPSMNIENSVTSLPLNKPLENENEFNNILKQYALNSSDSVDDIINLSVRYINKTTKNHEDYTDFTKFISKKNFATKYNIKSISALYSNIKNNKRAYEKLFNIYDIRKLKNYYEYKNANNKNNIGNADNLKATNIDFNPGINSSKKEPQYKDLQYYGPDIERCLDHINDKTMKKNTHFTKHHNLYMAKGLLGYYNNNWNLDKDIERRNNIAQSLKKFDSIYQNFNANKKMSVFNEDFNSLQSILLDYYKFLLFFSKYNYPIILFNIKTKGFTNYQQVFNIPEYDLFIGKYLEFINSIEKNLQTVKKFVNDMLTGKFTYLENENINDNSGTTLKEFSATKKDILEIKSNFQEIFNLMQINNIVDNKISDADDLLKNIDRVPKIDENIKKLNLYSINAAPPHYRVNLDILATVLKMEIFKLLPYLKKMPNTTVLNDQEKNTDINFTQSKQKIGDYIQQIYQFYDQLKSYMVWSMNKKLCNAHSSSNSYVYSKKAVLSKPISNIMGKEEDFIKNIKTYIQDDDQFYTTLYFPPNSKNSSKELSEQLSDLKLTKPEQYLNIFKFYYIQRQDMVNDTQYPLKLFAEHVIKKQKIYDNLMNSNVSDMSDMKLLDQFFSELDPGYFSILTKNNANANNPTLMDNNKLLLQENKDNKNSIAKQLEHIKLNSNQNSLTYNNNLNKNSIFQKNYDHYMITDNTKPNIIDINLTGDEIFENNIFKDDSSENDLSLDKNEQQNNQNYDFISKKEFNKNTKKLQMTRGNQYLTTYNKNPNMITINLSEDDDISSENDLSLDKNEQQNNQNYDFISKKEFNKNTKKLQVTRGNQYLTTYNKNPNKITINLSEDDDDISSENDLSLDKNEQQNDPNYDFISKKEFNKNPNMITINLSEDDDDISSENELSLDKNKQQNDQNYDFISKKEFNKNTKKLQVTRGNQYLTTYNKNPNKITINLSEDDDDISSENNLPLNKNKQQNDQSAFLKHKTYRKKK